MASLPLNTLLVAAGTLEWLERLDSGFPITVALAAVALLGYLFGQRTRNANPSAHDSERARELERASGIARQLETIAESLRHDLASHHGRLLEFRERVSQAKSSQDEAAWKQLFCEAEEMLSPTLQLAEQLSMAYDAIRRQSDALETFTQARIDPCTGVGNGRALDEKLEALIGASRRGGAEFSLVLLGIDRKPIHLADEDHAALAASMAELAELVRACMRQYDFVARYGDDEFAVLMPQAKIVSAGVFGERLRQLVVEEMKTTVSCGVAQFHEGDDAKSLLSRADSALYSAKAAGGNKQFVHNGAQIRERRDSVSEFDRPQPTPTTPDPVPIVATVSLNLVGSHDAVSQ
jgi:diguanylate cyclase (GGDEF)-like protein